MGNAAWRGRCFDCEALLECLEIVPQALPASQNNGHDSDVQVVNQISCQELTNRCWPSANAHIQAPSAEGIPLIDGGMWANNPVGVAVVEAIGMLGWPREDIRVLSIGCTTQPLGVGRARWWPLGLGYWGWKVADVFMTAQSHAALGTAYTLLGGHEHVIRISPHVGRGRFSMDNVREIPSLRGLGASEARKALPQLRPRFFTTPADPFVPCRRLPGPIQVEGSAPPLPGDTEAHA